MGDKQEYPRELAIHEQIYVKKGSDDLIAYHEMCKKFDNKSLFFKYVKYFGGYATQNMSDLKKFADGLRSSEEVKDRYIILFEIYFGITPDDWDKKCTLNIEAVVQLFDRAIRLYNNIDLAEAILNHTNDALSVIIKNFHISEVLSSEASNTVFVKWALLNKNTHTRTFYKSYLVDLFTISHKAFYEWMKDYKEGEYGEKFNTFIKSTRVDATKTLMMFAE